MLHIDRPYLRPCTSTRRLRRCRHPPSPSPHAPRWSTQFKQRLSQKVVGRFRGGFDGHDAARVAAWLAEAGVNFIEIPGGNFESTAWFGDGASEGTRAHEAHFFDFARTEKPSIQRSFNTPPIVTGGFRSGQITSIQKPLLFFLSAHRRRCRRE